MTSAALITIVDHLKRIDDANMYKNIVIQHPHLQSASTDMKIFLFVYFVPKYFC